MKSKTYLKLAEVFSVVENPKQIARYYYYRSGRFLFREGVREWTGMPISRWISEESMKSLNIYVDNKEVYYKPYLEISLNSGKKHTKYFDSIEEMVAESIEIRKSRTEWYTL